MAKHSSLTVALALVLTSAAPLHANPGDLDPTFGGGGYVAQDLSPSSDVGMGVAVQDDGRVIVAGSSRPGDDVAATVLRFTQTGQLDASFASGGVFQLPGAASYARDAVVQTDGKIVVVGQKQNAFLVFRLDGAGALDPGFGAGGVVITGTALLEVAEAVALQPDGRIVVVGRSSGPGSLDFAVARYDAGGTLDPTFGVGGIVKTDAVPGLFLDDEALDVVIQPDGKLVVAGDSGGNPDGDVCVVRYLANGTLDPSFGSGGIVRTDLDAGDPNDYAYGVRLQGAAIVVAGYSFDDATAFGRLAVVRYRPTGALDPAFGAAATGIVLTDVGSAPGFEFDEDLGMEIQCDGKIVVGAPIKGAGGFGDGGTVVVRFDPGGTLDPGFATGGIASFDFGAGENAALDLAIDRGGRVVVAGYGDPNVAGYTMTDVVVARLHGSGGCLGEHYLCHKSRVSHGAPVVTPIVPLELEDQFYTQRFEAYRTRYLCPPADKRGEGILEPDVGLATYLIDYLPGDALHETQRVRMTTQFGTISGLLLGPHSLMVPTAIDTVAQPPPPVPGHKVDHFKCYCFKPDTPTVTEAPIAHALWPAGSVYRIRRARRVCTPTDAHGEGLGSEGEGIEDPARHLVCFQVKARKPPAKLRDVFLTNAFGAQRWDVKHGFELCVPARKEVLPTAPSERRKARRCAR